MYRQLDIYWVNLDPATGAETKKKRPCVIIQSDIVNKGARTFIVAPILPHHKEWPFAVNIDPTEENGLDKPRHINLKQLRVVDVMRIDNKQGSVESFYIDEINQTLKLIFDI